MIDKPITHHDQYTHAQIIRTRDLNNGSERSRSATNRSGLRTERSIASISPRPNFRYTDSKEERIANSLYKNACLDAVPNANME